MSEQRVPLALRADRLVWRFRKSGGDGAYTKPFEELDPSSQLLILERVDMQVDERPVLACVLGKDHWTVLTTGRVLWRYPHGAGDLAFSEIADATVRREAIGAAGTMSELRELAIAARGGVTHLLSLEAGKPFSGLWSVLKTIAHATVVSGGTRGNSN
jgi:hypothetical protein